MTAEETIEEKEARKLAIKEQKKELKAVKLARRNERLSKRPLPTTFVGQHKWLGGAVDPITGKIYGIPSHAIDIICITPPSQGEDAATISTIPLPNEYKVGHFKWLRGIIHDGYLYGIPAWSTHGVLMVRLQEKSKTTRGPRVKLLPLPRPASHYQTSRGDDEATKQRGNDAHSNVDRGRWMWHGGQVGVTSQGNAAIYCIPSNAEHVLKIDLTSEQVTEIGPALYKGQNKWYGGISGKDGCIYGMPYTATGVLRIDPKSDSVEVLGDYPEGGYKWHGGLLAHSTGVIYAFPAHANEVLCVDTNPNGKDGNQSDIGDQSRRVSCIPIQRHAEDVDPPDQHYKWLGGAYGADGCIYGMPSDATSILRIDPITNQAVTFGRVSSVINKWQGGVLSAVDKCVYAVPADMDCVLRVDTDPNTPLSIDMVGSGFQNVGDKWQGGFVAKDDRIYAIPENVSNVMVITPGESPNVEMLV